MSEEAKKVFDAALILTTVTTVESLIKVLRSLEEALREEIKLRSQAIVVEISTDIQAMWALLHPGEAIEDIRLYVPKDSDKAIDICLKFHGKEQDSPRLTLSEGHRNSLGLCIFLAMARRDSDTERPLILDDVVVSLDRNHRGMIVDLLQQKFSDRQIIVLTHDRDWYVDLRQQLDQVKWLFRTLLPYDSPKVGIRWSQSTSTFGDARAQLKERPDSAGNDARKIMDSELANIAERLRLQLPYLRAERNERRTAHEFLERLVSSGKRCFQIRSEKEYALYEQAVEALHNADQLLVTWGNRASHTADLVRPEAERLINACEQALEAFKCSSCRKNVWFADASSAERLQCECAQLRWRYSKD